MADNSEQLRQTFYDYVLSATSDDDRIDRTRELVAANPDILERNRAAQERALNYIQYDFEPDTYLDRVAADEAAIRSSVPFGLEEAGAIGQENDGVLYGLNIRTPQYGQRIFVPGKQTPTIKNTYLHEGIHSFTEDNLSANQDELSVRALDLFRARRIGDPELIKGAERFFIAQADRIPLNDLKKLYEDSDDPAVKLVFLEMLLKKKKRAFTEEDEKKAREAALLGATSLNDAFYKDLTEAEKKSLREGVGEYMDQFGFFEPPVLDPSKMSEEEFQGILNLAPGLTLKNYARSNFESPQTYKPRARKFADGGVAGYFERPEIDGMLYSSEFEKDVSEKPGYEYGMILPISTNVETGESQFDLAGGITGGIGRGLSTLDRSLSGISVADEELMEGLMNVVGPSAGIAGVTAGPGQLPGLIGAFNLKHGSGALFDKLRRSETGAAGPGVYGAEDTGAALGYALSRAEASPLTKDLIAYEYKEMYEDPSEASNVIAYAIEGANKAVDKTSDTTNFIFKDGSMMRLNRALSYDEMDYIEENGVPKYLIEDLESGKLDLKFQGGLKGYIYDIAIKETKDDFFDFTKPLKDQPLKHRQALLELAEKTGYDSPDEMGGFFYRHLEGFYGSDDAASKKLSDLGIIGNKTLLGLNDEAYVIFDPDKIEIKGREVADFADGGVAGLAPIAQNMFRN